jgi:uncharacterized protein involved in exopolysaccharide biosynthesis
MSDPLSDFQNKGNSEEFDLSKIWQVLVQYRLMILSFVLIAGLIAAGVSMRMPNIYRAEVLLAPIKGDETRGGGLAALGGLGGFASLAGISLGGGGNTDENLAVLRSREFLWQFVQEKNLMPILFDDKWDDVQKKWKESDPGKQPGQLDAVRLLNDEGVLGAGIDKKNNLVTVSIDWKDPKLAAAWVDQLVTKLNQYIRAEAILRSENNLKYLNEELVHTQVEEMRKALFDLIGQEQKKSMVAHAQREYAFHVLDRAVVPDKKIKPKRATIVLLAGLFGGSIGILIGFFLYLKDKLQLLPAVRYSN